MTEADALWERTQRIFAQWGIAEIPFTETATLDRLVQLDLLQRLPSDRAVEYTATPMIAAGGAAPRPGITPQFKGAARFRPAESSGTD